MGIAFRFYRVKESWGWMLVMTAQQCDAGDTAAVPLRTVKMVNFMLIMFYYNKKSEKEIRGEKAFSKRFLYKALAMKAID